jgi:hypothetical protein
MLLAESSHSVSQSSNDFNVRFGEKQTFGLILANANRRVTDLLPRKQPLGWLDDSPRQAEAGTTKERQPEGHLFRDATGDLYLSLEWFVSMSHAKNRLGEDHEKNNYQLRFDVWFARFQPGDGR